MCGVPLIGIQESSARPYSGSSQRDGNTATHKETLHSKITTSIMMPQTSKASTGRVNGRNGHLRAKTHLPASAQLCECLVPIFIDIIHPRNTKSQVYHPSQGEDRLLSTAKHSHPARERRCRSWERRQLAAEHNDRGQNPHQEAYGSKRPRKHSMHVHRYATR